jgi:hypothetical protein
MVSGTARLSLEQTKESISLVLSILFVALRPSSGDEPEVSEPTKFWHVHIRFAMDEYNPLQTKTI